MFVGNTATIVLNQFDTFQVQARCAGKIVLATECHKDLTGTMIYSDMPIHVFSGNVRSFVPNRKGASRDHLVEQLLSVDK